jgi:hypothetical protein
VTDFEEGWFVGAAARARLANPAGVVGLSNIFSPGVH